MALVKYRAYIETTVITDWMFLETVPRKNRKNLSQQVLASHELMTYILQGGRDIIDASTSSWAIFEALGAIKRANIQAWMLYDGIPTSYYYERGTLHKYRLRESQVKKINGLLRILWQGDRKNRPIRLLAENSDINAGSS